MIPELCQKLDKIEKNWHASLKMDINISAPHNLYTQSQFQSSQNFSSKINLVGCYWRKLSQMVLDI